MTQQGTALILPGGGARAAYQVGVLQGLADFHEARQKNPYPILCGTSAGAINAVAIAARCDSFVEACRWLQALWLELTAAHVYRTDWLGLFNNARRLMMSLFNTGIAIGRPVGLLDNLPLKQLLGHEIPFHRISELIRSGHLDAVCVTAMNYTSNRSVSFFQGGPEDAGWQRWRRQGIPTPLQLRHLLASTAIPTIFPPQRIGRNYYGDGALRQLTPISPALHLGANRVFVVPASGHRREYIKPIRRVHSPSLGQIIGHLLNSAFVDSLETDIELLERINQMLELMPDEAREKLPGQLKPIESLVLSPSEDIDSLAEEYVKELPRSVRSFLRITGSGKNEGGVNIASYLLFTPAFCQRLIDMGRRDAHDAKDEIMAFVYGENAITNEAVTPDEA